MTMLPQETSSGESLLEQIVARRRELRAKFFPPRHVVERMERERAETKERARLAAEEEREQLRRAEKAAEADRMVRVWKEKNPDTSMIEVFTPFRDLVNAVSGFYGLSESDLAGPSQCAQVVLARQVATLLCREELRYSLTKIGVKFNRDHTTVGHSVEKIVQRIAVDPEFAAAVDAIRQEIGERRNVR
ncbi:MAG: helix-turn-helix domain-containing protein [Methylocella sp.]